MVIRNVSGAGGSIGVARVARAAPDGHTLSIGQWTSHVGSGAMYQVTYDLLNDFEPIAQVASAAMGRRKERVPSERPERNDGLAKGEPRQSIGCVLRYRKRPAYLCALSPNQHGRAVPNSALSRCCPSDARFVGRTDRFCMRNAGQLSGACASRPAQGLCRDVQRPLVWSTGGCLPPKSRASRD